MSLNPFPFRITRDSGISKFLPSRRRRNLALICGAALLLSACGTNVPVLLEKESRLEWESAQVLADAELEGHAFEDDFYAVEDAKFEACEPLYQNVMQRVDKSYEEGGLSFGEHFVSDLMLLGALIFPVPSVEACADAHDRYHEEFQVLRDRLENRTVAFTPRE